MENPAPEPSANEGENKRRAADSRRAIRDQAARIRKLIFPPDEPTADG